jgi:hypothetical protein
MLVHPWYCQCCHEWVETEPHTCVPQIVLARLERIIELLELILAELEKKKQ